MVYQLVKKRLLLFLLIIIFCPFGFSQQENKLVPDSVRVDPRYYKAINPMNFDSEFLEELILVQLNKQLQIRYNSEGLISDTLLKKAAIDQAQYMAMIGDDEITGKGKKKTTGQRVEFYGGSTYAKEIIRKVPIKKGKEYFTYKNVTENLVFKWLNNTKQERILNNPEFIFIGIGVDLGESGRRVYASAVLSNYKLYNEGATKEKRKEMAVPYTTKKYGLKPYNDRACRKCDKLRSIGDFQKGLFIKDGEIYFKHDNIRAFKKIIRKPKDALAVDIVQRVQYKCDSVNITDHNLVNKGVMTKRIWSKKLYKKNIIKGKRIRKLEVCLGKFPEDITGDYELNLIIIQQKHICKNISQFYIIEADVVYVNDITLLADTVTTPETAYTPLGGSTSLNFNIPFEKDKHTYKPEDIEPFLAVLKEPEFTIDDVNISAYSSIEGTERGNKALQKNRAESIIRALRSRQKGKIKTNVTTGENWEKFKQDVRGTEFENIASMSLKKAQEYISENNLDGRLEPILKNHRYAKIEMNVTYDTEGDKEEQYVLAMFNKAVRNNETDKALSIQKYLIKKIFNEEYSRTVIDSQEIPEESRFAGILMNKLCLTAYVNNDDPNDEYCKKIEDLYSKEPSNKYIYYNKLYCEILHDNQGEDDDIEDMQDKIDELYESELGQEVIDVLNLEFQFKVIKNLDTLDTPHPLLIKSLNRIKQIVNLEEANWQNSLKLAYIFVAHKDYEFATKLLEPFIDDEHIFEELLFTYISLCSYSYHRQGSNRFVTAMKRARGLNKERYCALYDGSKFSFQIFDNPKIKEDYCSYCK